MADTLQFTKAALEALAPAAKVLEVRDAKQPGLILRVTPAGSKTFYFYRWTKGAAKRHLIGRFPGITIERARDMAKRYDANVAEGGDPTARRGAAKVGQTLDDLFEWWAAAHGIRKASATRDRQQYELYVRPVLGARRAAEVTRGELRELHATIGQRAPVAANRVLALVRAVYNRALDDEVLQGANPATRIKPFQELARDRRLTRAEADALFVALAATDSQQLRDLVLLLLFTGQRKTNVMAMRWEQLDLDAALWRIPKTKNGRPQLVPLLDAELAILRRRKANVVGPWVFPGRGDGGATGHLVEPKNGWRGVLKRAKLDGTDLRMHDLRRSLGSFMVDTGASLEVIGKTLGHQSPAATSIYARLSLEPVKEAKARALAAMTCG